jgi:hypothetical protein
MGAAGNYARSAILPKVDIAGRGRTQPPSQICGEILKVWTASGHQGSPNPSSTRISPFAGLTEWSC